MSSTKIFFYIYFALLAYFNFRCLFSIAYVAIKTKRFYLPESVWSSLWNYNSKSDIKASEKTVIGFMILIPCVIAGLFNVTPFPDSIDVTGLHLSSFDEYTIVTIIPTIFLILLLLKFTILGLLAKRKSYLVSSWASFLNYAGLVMLFLLFERFLLKNTAGLIGLVVNLAVLAFETILMISGVLLCFICVSDLLNPGGLHAYIQHKEKQYMDDLKNPEKQKEIARRKYEEKLDDIERDVNMAIGLERMTDQEAYEAGKKDIYDHLRDEAYREEKMKKYDKKNK